jgi:uncharacterized protein YggU (UPF0235/DUF167 family)
MYIKVKVEAGSKKEKIEKISSLRYKIQVKEHAERNMANDRICYIIANLFKVNPKKVRIISGHHHSSKILSVEITESLL